MLDNSQRRIIELLAAGHSYAQVLTAEPQLTYADIVGALGAAVLAIDTAMGGPADHVASVRRRHPNAYRPWTEALDNELVEKFDADVPIRGIATDMGRTQGAIRARLVRSGRLTPNEANEGDSPELDPNGSEPDRWYLNDYDSGWHEVISESIANEMYQIAASQLAERALATAQPIEPVIAEFESLVGSESTSDGNLVAAMERLLEDEELARRLVIRDDQRTWDERRHWRD